MSAPIRTYTVPEAAELLHVTRRTLSRLVQQKKLRKTKIGKGTGRGSRTVFRESELLRLLDRATAP